jgi:hypothetical protein
MIHVVAWRCLNRNSLLRGLMVANADDLPLLTLAEADETTAPGPDSRGRYFIKAGILNEPMWEIGSKQKRIKLILMT